MKRIKRKFIKFWICLVILVLIMIFAFIYVNNYFGSRVELYAKQKATQLASDTIGNVLNEKVLSLIDMNDILDIDDGVVVQTKVLNEILKNVNNSLGELTNNNDLGILEIPYAVLFSEVLFSRSSLCMAVCVRPIGAYTTDIVSSVTDYGINNSLFKVDLIVKVIVDILIPYNTHTVEVITNIPIVMTIIEGEVPPGIWYGNYNNS